MYRRHTASAAAVVRLPPLPRRPKTNVSVIEDATENPWGLDNPALRQLSTHGSTRGTRNRSRSTRRSFRSSKITLPDINGRKTRQPGSARSMRSNYSTLSATTVKSTKSLDMFRYNMTGLKTPASISSAPNLQVPAPHYNRKWQTPGSAISINSVSTIPLPPIELTVHRAYSRDDLASTVIPDELEDDEDDDMSVWPGAAYDSPRYSQSNVLDHDFKVEHRTTPPPDYHHVSDHSEGALTRENVASDRHRGDTNNNDIVVSSRRNTDGDFRYQTQPEAVEVARSETPSQDKLPHENNFQQTGMVEQEDADDASTDFRYAENTEQEATSKLPEPEVDAHVKLAEEIHRTAEAEFKPHRKEQEEGEFVGITVTGGDAPPEDDTTEQEEDPKMKRLTPEEEERRFRSLPPAVQVARVFAGDFRFLPPMTRTSVRVFFWASPNGFHEEREWIHAKCHSDLQEFCAAKGLDFHLVDLHLPGYDHVSHEIMDEIFRDQLAICQRLSIGPTVLALVNGDDMPRALPPSISAPDFSAICEIADRKELPHRELLTSHFRPLVLASGEPVERYQLQTTTLGRKGSTSGAETERRELLGEWDMAAVRLRELLRKTLVTAVVERKITKVQAKAYLDSESFDNQEGDPDSDPGDQVRQMVSSYPGQTLCYIRQHLEENEADPQGLSRASTSASISSSSERDRSSAAINAMIGGRLSVDISKKLNFLTYPVPSMGSHGRVYNLQPLRDEEAEPANLSQQRRTYLTKLCDDILCDVKGVVNASTRGKSELEKCWMSSPLHCEVLHHARLCSSRAAAYCGQQAYLSKVRDYLLDSNYSMVPLVISGGADKNKSKLMAQVGQQVHHWLQTECAVIVRFVGTSTDSSDIKRILLGIIYQICVVYSMAMPKLEEVTSFDATLSCFNALLASVAIKHCAFKPLVLLLDCLEKATSTEGNHTAAWVPQLCPPNVYLVTSIASDCQHLLDVLKVKLVEDVCFLSLDKPLEKPPSPPIPSHQKPQTTKHREDKSIDSSDISDTDSCATEGTLEADGEEEMEGEAGLAELVSKRLDTLEDRHGEVVITWMLSYLSIGEGLSEVELLDALSCNEEVMEEVYIGSDVPLGNRQRFPQKLWAMVQRDIRGFLEERYIDKKLVLSLSDEQVQETVESRYLNEGRLCECCTQLANMLQGSQSGLLYDDDEDDDMPVQRLVAPQPLSVTNHRKLRRLPRLLYRSQPFDCISNELKSRMLCDFTWLLTKLKSHQFHNVIEDFHMVRESDDDIEYVRDLLLLCKSVIERDPDMLCAEILSRLSQQDFSNKPFLHQLRRDASSWCSNLSQGMYIVPKFPCFPSPSGFLRRTIRGPWHIMGMCGDSLMMLWGRETGLEVWNATTSECLHHFCNPFTWEDTCLTEDCRSVYQTHDTNLVGWDVHTAKKICDINILPAVSDTGRRQNPNTDDSFMTPMAISEDRMFAAIRINKPEMLLDGKGLVLVDLHRELVVHKAIDSMGDRVSNCRFTKDNNRLVVTETQIMPGQVSEIHIFDCLTMESMGEQKLDDKYTILPDTAFFSADESKLIVGCRPDNFLVFSVSDCSPVFIPLEPADEDLSRFVDMKVLPTDQVVLLSVDIAQSAVLRLSSLDGIIQGPIMTSNTGRPKFLEVAPWQSLAFVGYLDVGTVDIWDLDKGYLVYTLRAHTGHMTSTVMSPSCHTLYTGATDGAIKVWKFGDMLRSKGRTIESARTPRPLLEPNLGNDRIPPIRDTMSMIPTDVDEILELDGGESLVDSDDEQKLEDKNKADGKEVDRESMWSTISESNPTEHDMNDNEEEFDSDDSEGYDASCYDTVIGEMMSTATGSRLQSGSTRCTSKATSKAQQDQSSGTQNRQSADYRKMTDSARSARSSGSKQSANTRRNNPSAPGWARDGSFLNRTIKEDEMVANSPGIDIQQLVSGQRLSSRTHIRDGSFSNRSGYSVKSHQSQKSSQGERDSTANTDRTSDTNAKLEEIFRKLDQQALDETPRYDSFREPLLTTTVLGKYGEVLDSQDVETKDVNTFQPTEDGIHMVTTHRKGPPILWSIDRAEIVHRLEVPWDTGTTTELLLAPDGKRVFGLSRLGYEAAEYSGYENCVRVWDLETGTCEPMPSEPLYADAFVLTPDKKRLILLRKRDNGHTRFLVLDAESLERLLLGEVGSTLCSPYVHVTSDVRYVITCDPGCKVSIWDVLNEDEYGVARHTDLPLATIPPAMTLLDKEQTLLLGTGFGNVLALPLSRVADLPHQPDAALLVAEDRHQGEVLCLELSRDKKLLVTSASDHTMRVVEREEKKTRHVLRGHTDLITCLELSEDKQWLVSGSHDKTLRMWNMETGQMTSSFHTYHDVFNVHLSLDNRTISCLVDQHGARRLIMLDVVRARQKEATANPEVCRGYQSDVRPHQPHHKTAITMNKPRQTTLFQSWQSSQTARPGSATAKPSTSSTGRSGIDQFDDEDEDEDLLRAMELSLQESLQSQAALQTHNPAPTTVKSNSSSGLFSSVYGQNESKRPTQVLSELNNNSRQKSCNPSSLGLFKKNQPKQGTLLKYSDRNELTEEELYEEPEEELTEEQLAALDDIPGFDKGAGQMWIYPTNYPVREYQFNIVKEALFTNTLVVLPTGLGKTFISAVVMYNFYRWYPQGRIIFMAPTKPLVAQQIEACHNIMGIQQRDTAEMTGAMQPADRKLAWQSRRIFFLTPQVLTNDLSREACPGHLVKCLVIDEAHKAQGNHAYCQVVKELAKYEGEFRVLALSATPGSDMKAVQQVITNLMVAHVELRGEDSPDIKQYTHERTVEKMVVPLGQELTAVKEKYLRVMNTVVNRLKRLGVVYNREVTSLSKFLILKSREAFRQNPPHNLPNQQFGAVEGDFALAISLYHGYDLLQQHGLRSLQSYLLSLVSGEKGYGRTRTELLRNNDFTDMMEMIKRFTPVKNTLPCTQLTQSASQLATPYEVGHPKMAKLQDIAVEHFTNFQGDTDNAPGAASTRIMVFAQYRDSVSEITEMLNRHRPLIKCMSFIGQSSVGKATKGFTQKEQLLVMKKFREGGYNTLVSTCVGEEGLDIGDVDLIICFDAHKSPIRLVQRMGRTGRKRQGRIIMLVTAGKEEQIYNQSQYTKRSIHKAIQNGARSLIFYPNSGRMVPDGLRPRCHRMHITVKEAYVQRTKGTKATKASTKPSTTKTAAVGKKPVSDGFLTPEELRYWSEHYKMKEEEIPKLPTSNFVSLKQSTKRSAPQKGPLLSLSEWMPWQNRLQPTVLVGHSMQSKHLVDVVEFMQIQATIGDDEDPYGQEMQTYLNKEDVNVKSKSQGMMRYCTPSVATAKTATTVDKVSHPRRSKQLPTFSSDEENLLVSSDEDLPTFDGIKTKGNLLPIAKTKAASRKSCKERVLMETVQEQQVTASEGDFDLAAAESDDERPRPPGPDDLPEVVVTRPSVSPKGKGKGKTMKTISKTTDETVQKKVSKSPRDDVTRKVKKKKKRSSSDRINQSIVALIDDPTDEDFEGVSSVKPKLDCKTVGHGKSHIIDDGRPHQIVDIENGNEVSSEKCNTASDDVVMVSDSDGNYADMDCDQPLPDIHSSKDDAVLSQAFPFFTPHKAFMEGCQEKEASLDVSGMKRVRTPPPVEELQNALTDLDCKGSLSPVDMLGLIDKWEQEKSASSQSRSPPHPTAKEVSKKGKISIATTPVRISSASSRPPIPKGVCTTNGGKSEEAQESIDADLTEEMFFDGSIVMDEPEPIPKDNRVETGQNPKQHRERERSPMLKTLEHSTEERIEEISRISNTSTSPSKSPVPVTPFYPRSSRNFYFQSNTSTPMCNTAAPNLGSSPTVKKSNMAKDTMTLKEKLINAKENRRKSDPCASPSGLCTKAKAVQLSRRSASPMHDSFFSDFNDSAFAAMATQAPVVETPPVVKRISPVAMKPPSAVADKTPMGRANMIPFSHVAKVTPVSALETSQLTFTQALACVNDSTDTSRSANSLSPSPQPGGNKSQHSGLPLGRQMESVRLDMDVREAEHVQQRNNPPLEVPCVNNEPNIPPVIGNPASTTVSKQEEEDPQFDLGFDFDDDFDDEMVVPPSPPQATTSQGFSVRLRADTTASTSSHLNSNPTEPVVNEQSMDTCHAITDIDHHDDDSRESSGSPVFFSVTQQSGAVERTSKSTSSDGIAPLPAIAVADSGANFSDSLEAIFADGDSEELFCDEDDWDPGQQDIEKGKVSSVPEEIPVRPSSPVIVRSPSKSDFKTPVKPAPRTSRPYKPVTGADDSPILPSQKRQRPSVMEDDANEDSPIAPPSKRHRPLVGLESDEDSPVAPAWARQRSNVIIEDSPIGQSKKRQPPMVGVESDEDSPVAPARTRNRRPAVLDDSPVAPPSKRQLPMVWQEPDEDSPIAPVRPRQRTKAIVDLTADEDDDFASSNKHKRANVSTKRSSYSVVHKKPSVVPKPRKVSAAADFLDVEAERSEDDCSEDELDEENDEYDQSFVNDCTQMTQADRENAPDMRAVYLRSVRSPVRSGGHYRFARPRNDVIDVFSQVPQQDTDYMEDSFVVDGDDSEDYVDDGAEDEVTLLDLGPNVTMSRQTRRQARAARRAPPKAAPRPKVGRRVVRVVDSSSEEEAERIAPSQAPVVKKKHAILSTSSSSSNTSPSPQRPEGSKGHQKNVNEKQSSAGRQLPVSPLKVSQEGKALLTGLHARCMQRLQKEAGTGYNPTRIDSANSSRSNKPTSAKTHEQLLPPAESKPTPVYEDPTFSLGVDFLDMDDNWNDDDDPVPDAASPVLKSKSDLQPKLRSNSNAAHGNVCNTNSVTNRTLNETGISDRERRIQLSRQRQEEFRRKMAAPSTATSTSRQTGNHFGSQIYPPSQSPQVTANRRSDIAPTPTPAPTRSESVQSLVTPERNTSKGRMVVLVDSREINGARELISTLRFKHNAQTVIRQLADCDFIISNRMAVDRILHSIFTNGSRKDKLVRRVRAMCELYDRPCIIVEKDPLKPDQQQAARQQPNTKYTDSIMAALAQTHIKLLFSNSQEHTAGLMADLAVQEAKKEQAIQVSTDLTEGQEQMLRFYMSLPRMSYVVALNLVHGFRSVADMVRGTDAQFVRSGKMSQVRATELRNHLRRKFDLQMLSIRS